ncbi:NHL repeat-containing protein [candidate division KSB1 bacterium]
MSRFKVRSTLFTGLIALLLTAAVAAQEIEMIDGVRVVHNGKGVWGDTPAVTLHLEKTLGSLETLDENFMFYLPADIARDKEGNLYILDQGNYRIQKLDAEGNFIKSFGSEGQGPAEFMRPLSIDIDNDGSMYIIDQGNNRIQILNPGGSNKGTIPLESGAGYTRLLSNGNMLMAAQGGMMMFRMEMLDNPQVEPLFHILDQTGEKTGEFGDAKEFNDFLLNRMANRISFTTDSEDNVYVSFRFQNRIEKYDPSGKAVLRIDRELNYEESNPEPNKDNLSVSGRAGNQNVRISMPELNLISEAVDVDAKGRIWVVTAARQEREEETVQQMVAVTMDGGRRSQSIQLTGATDLTETDMYKIEIFSPDGILLGSIPLTHFCHGMRIFDDKLYIVDQTRGMQYYEYRIIEK